MIPHSLSLQETNRTITRISHEPFLFKLDLMPHDIMHQLEASQPTSHLSELGLLQASYPPRPFLVLGQVFRTSRSGQTMGIR